jgi:hypothetical protein
MRLGKAGRKGDASSKAKQSKRTTEWGPSHAGQPFRSAYGQGGGSHRRAGPTGRSTPNVAPKKKVIARSACRSLSPHRVCLTGHGLAGCMAWLSRFGPQEV